MLLRLALRNFVLIDETEIEFDDGFCAFTGETGAGKSLLVGALSLLAGGRAPAGLIKSGGLAAEIEAFFDLADLPFMSAWLKTHNLDGEDKMLARRIIFDDARKSRAYINGRASTACANGRRSIRHGGNLRPARTLFTAKAGGSSGTVGFLRRQ